MPECYHKTVTLARPLRAIRLRGDDAAEERRHAELREARQRGYDAAIAETRAESDAQRQEVAVLRDQTLRHLAEREERLFDDLRQALPGLVIEGVQSVLAGIELEASMVETIVRGILEDEVSDREGLTVFLSPRDHDLLKEIGNDLSLQYPNLKLQQDAALQPGDCLVRSRFGVTDARRETKLANLRNALA